jgi:hypothetical protein
MAAILQRVLGDLLYIPTPEDATATQWRTPNELRNKVRGCTSRNGWKLTFLGGWRDGLFSQLHPTHLHQVSANLQPTCTAPFDCQ